MGALGVDPVEVGGPGEDQPLRRGVVEEPVQRDGARGEDVRPAGAHGSVRISLPVSVTRIVCSNCAVRDRSLVVTVHPSSQMS